MPTQHGCQTWQTFIGIGLMILPLSEMCYLWSVAYQVLIITEKTIMSELASFKRRMAALCYEGLLLSAITCVAFIPAALANKLLHPFPHLAQLAVSLCFIGTWWLYWRWSIEKQGQTLPMRVWHLHLSNQHAQRPSLRQLRLRFMWSVVCVVFLPLCAYWALRVGGGISACHAFLMALLWWILPWGFALVHPSRQFLYDFLAGTRLVYRQNRL